MKLKTLLAFSLIISVQSLAQVLSRDFFPLTVGNSWTYKYYDLDDEAPGDFLNNYYGTGTYRIISKSLSVDSTRQVSLFWNRKAAEVRPSIAKYARLLSAMFRMDKT